MRPGKNRRMRVIHFIGIGGVGMNGLAQLAALSGYSVSGSDRGYNPEAAVFQSLENLGVRIFPQNGSGIVETTDQVVYSSAIESGNPDLQQAEALGISLFHRAEFLKYLIGEDNLIAVAGTAGKTTTTGLLGWIFHCLGKDPSVYNGAAVLNWKKPPTLGNIRKGSSNLWIIEADESDKSFLNFHPTHTIITNISKDHYELDELNSMFDQFESQTSGTTIRGHVGGQSDGFVFEGIKFQIPMLGKHNLENAQCAVRLCAKLGMNMERVRDAVARFQGIERRLEVVGKAGAGITVIDDYAHNAAKIVAALSATTEAFGRVRAFWRPHGFAPLFHGMDDLVEAFKMVHPASLFILPVYYAGGTVDRKTSSAEFVRRLNSAGISARLVPDYATLKQDLEQCAELGDAILGMGARDPQLPLFAQQLVAQWKMS